jgi:Ca2+-binding RTX toxin-like protein
VASKLDGIERIDLGSVGNTLIVNQLSILGGVGAVQNGRHVLVVGRNLGDKVQFVEPGWTKSGSLTNADCTFDRWVLGDAEVHVEQNAGVTIIGTSGSDTISTTVTVPGQFLATALDDTIDGRGGADTMAGGLGNDTYIVDNAGDGVTELAGGGIDAVLASVDWTLGANVENLVLTGSAHIQGTGNALVNLMTGNAGNNRLDGGAGADKMAAGLGDDTYLVDAAGDVVTEGTGEGTDTVIASIGWVLGANVENLVLTGSGDLNGTGNALGNVLTGNAGKNVLDGGLGADKLTGGAGNDSYVVDNAGDVVTELADGGIDTVLASINWTLVANLEKLMLTGAASINGTGNALANVLTGNGGKNVLDGGAGADTMAGGLGDDRYVVDNAGDVVTELAGGGGDTVLASINWTLGANLERLTLTGIAHLAGTGNELANTLTGNAGNNLLDGGTGADKMAGGLGDDTYVVDVASDVVSEGADQGTDTVNAWIGLTLRANLEQLRLLGTGDLNGTGNGLNNSLWGNAGKNLLDGKAGADTARGGLGDDTYIIDNPGDQTIEVRGAGVDLVRSSITWALVTYVENLTLTGIASINGTGNGSNNVLTGNAGNNVLDGRAGADTMAGGLGDDTYVVDNALDVVTELKGGGVDTVLSSIDWTLGARVERLTLTGTAHRSGTGNEVANTLTGNAGKNVLDGKAGADTMAGGLGDDTYIVDAAGDVAVEEADAGTDTVQSSVTWQLRANFERLVLTGNANVNGTGNERANILTGNAGNNVLDGGAGIDSMAGGLGNDIYVIDHASDRANESAGGGTDTVLSSLSHTLRANLESLVLTGTAAINGSGNGEANSLTGNGAANVLDGKAGADRMEGRAATMSMRSTMQATWS